MRNDTLKSRNTYLEKLLEKAAAQTVERDVAERIQSVLTEELHHRMKNMLTVVSAIVRQSMRTAHNMVDAEQAITARLIAMGHAHDLLLKADLHAAQLSAVVAGATMQHDAGPGRILIGGEEIEIISSAVVPLTLLLNELCTNAAKYGALSTEKGHVSLSWNLSDDGKTFTLRWVEKDGPVVSTPESKGFGSRLIQEALPRQLGGTGKLSFPASGLEFELVILAKNLAVPEHN